MNTGETPGMRAAKALLQRDEFLTREEMTELIDRETGVVQLLEACKAAKKLLEPDLIEPGRTVFWKLVAAIANAERQR